MKHLIVALTALAPAVALAHPGHGHTEPASWTHYLTEPVHVVVLAASAALVILVHRARRRRRERRFS